MKDRPIHNEKVEAAGVIRDYLLKSFDLEYKLKRSKKLNEVLLNTGTTYVVDPYTKELLWTNDAIKMDHRADAISSKCYKNLQGKDAICEFCPFDKIEKQPGIPYIWIHKNSITDNIYLVIDIFLETGFNGFERPLHLVKAYELTENNIQTILELKNG